MTKRQIDILMKALPWLVVGAFLLWLIYLLRVVLTPFVLGLVAAYVFEPLIQLMQSKKISRPVAAFVGSALFLMFGLLVLLLVVPLVVYEIRLIYERLPTLVASFNGTLVPWLQNALGLQLDAASLRTWLSNNLDVLPSVVGTLGQSLRTGGSGVLGLLFIVVIAPVTMFFLLVDWERVTRFGNGLVPQKFKAEVDMLGHKMGAAFRGYMRGQVLVMLSLALYYGVALSLISLSYSVALGLLTGLLIFVPYLGYATGLLLSLLMAILQGGGWPLIVGVMAVYLIGQLLESFFLTPFLVGRNIGLHPLAVVLVLLIFGQLFGFFGVLLALPLSAVLNVLLKELHSSYLASDFYQGRL